MIANVTPRLKRLAIIGFVIMLITPATVGVASALPEPQSTSNETPDTSNSLDNSCVDEGAGEICIFLHDYGTTEKVLFVSYTSPETSSGPIVLYSYYIKVGAFSDRTPPAALAEIVDMNSDKDIDVYTCYDTAILCGSDSREILGFVSQQNDYLWDSYERARPSAGQSRCINDLPAGAYICERTDSDTSRDYVLAIIKIYTSNNENRVEFDLGASIDKERNDVPVQHRRADVKIDIDIFVRGVAGESVSYSDSIMIEGTSPGE